MRFALHIDFAEVPMAESRLIKKLSESFTSNSILSCYFQSCAHDQKLLDAGG